MEDGNLPPAAPPPRARPVGRPFPAGFPGHCAECNLAVHSGQSIIRMDDGTYQHAACAWDATAADPGPPT